MIEFEVRVLEINEIEFRKKLENLGAKFIGETLQRRYTYDFNPKRKSEWIRLRTSELETTLAIKHVKNNQAMDGTEELEIEVSDFDKTAEILKRLGYNPKLYQENKRARYSYQNIEFDIDSWPLIPTYVEIESNSKENIEEILKELDIPKDKITTLDVESIYNLYGININKIPILKFGD